VLHGRPLPHRTAMPPAATHDPKYLCVAAAIEAELRRGSWDGRKMPSVRGIALQHKVSVVTASRALQVLRDKGLIQTIERAGCYRIPPPTADRWAIVIRTTPGAWQRTTIAASRAGFEAVARREPMHLEFDAFRLGPTVTLGEVTAAATAALGDGVKGVFLLPARVSDEEAVVDRTFAAGCAQAGLPLVLLERGIRGDATLTHDIVALDDTAAGRACTEHLLALGRQRVGFVVGSPVSSHHDRAAGYLFAMHAAAETAPGKATAFRPILLRQSAALPTKDAYTELAGQVKREKLDGVVCYSDYTALGLVMELMQRGVRVPEDVAVVGFENLPIGDAFAVGLTSYDYPAEGLAEHAVRLMRERIKDPARPLVKVVVPGRLIVRNSTAGTG
jgi:LacI family transcriptional regulator